MNDEGTKYTYCGADFEHPSHEFAVEDGAYYCSGLTIYSAPPKDFPTSIMPDRPRPSKMCSDENVHDPHDWDQVVEEFDLPPETRYWHCWGVIEQPLEDDFTSSGVSWKQGVLFDRSAIPLANQSRADELAEWWMNQAVKETANLVPKAISYGSVDLDLMGDALLLLRPDLAGVVPKQELALAFYLMGKVSRIFGALEQGVAPSWDSWEDSSIYAKMALRVRQAGKW